MEYQYVLGEMFCGPNLGNVGWLRNCKTEFLITVSQILKCVVRLHNFVEPVKITGAPSKGHTLGSDF